MELTNDKVIFSPEFIPFYLEEVERYKLTPLEWLVYGFIRFYNKTKNKWFYFKSEQLAKILRASKWSIDNALSKLEKVGLIRRETYSVVWWWKIRKIFLASTSLNNEIPISSTSTSSNNEFTTSSNNEFHTSSNNEIKKNNIKENNKKNNISSYKDETQSATFSKKTSSKILTEPIIKIEQENLKEAAADLTNQKNVIKEVRNKKKEYGNPEINELLEIIKEFNDGVIDGTQKEQRYYWKLLLNKIKKVKAVSSWQYRWQDWFRMLLEIVSQNEYYAPKISWPKKIYYELATLIQAARSEFIKAKKNEIPSF